MPERKLEQEPSAELGMVTEQTFPLQQVMERGRSKQKLPKIREPRTKIVEGELTCQLVSPGSPVICMRYAVRLGRG